MIERKIIGELDYQSEANITKKMAMTLRHSSVIKVPSVFDDFSNENILTTEYFDGFNIDQVMKLDYHSKKSYAENLLTSFLELLKSGVLQADSNHGNFIFLKENYKIGLIDFGQIIEIDQRRKEAFYYLIFNLIKNKSIPYLSVLEEVGFQANRLEAIKDKIPLICSILFQPFLVNKNYYLEDWNYKKKLDQTLGEDKWILRAAGDQDLFLIMKSFMGFKNLIQKIGVPINWQQIFLESTSNMRIQIEEFKPKLIENDNTKEILFSKWINIEIYNDKVLSVSFKLPILEIFDLENQISDEIKLELKSKGIIVAKIINKAINNNAMPQKLFDFTQGKKSYHIFLT